MPKEILTTITASQARNLSKHIQEAAGTLMGIAELIEDEEGIDSLQVAKWKQTSDGIEYIETFISALRIALKRARQERGDFPPAIPARRKKPVSDSTNGARKNKDLGS